MRSLSKDHRFLRVLVLAGADMYRHYQWGPVVCQLRDFFPESLWRMWQWKLDAYEVPVKQKNKISLSIDQSDDVAGWNDLDLLMQERSGFFNRQILLDQEGDVIWRLVWSRDQAPVLGYRVSYDWNQIRILEDHTDTAGQAAFEYMSRMVLYAMIPKRVLSFHGVLMEHEKNGIILSAPSGTGKSTHARIWRDTFGSLIVNGDNACCYKKDGKWTGFGIPWSGTSGENVNRQVEIKALVVLHQAEENKVRKLSDYEAFTEVLPMLHCPVWDEKMSKLALDRMQEFLGEIPVYFLSCRPDRDSAEMLKRTLEV